jgi:hypothetical protein
VSASPQKKRSWEDKFKRLTTASQKAQEAVLVAIYEARQDGLSQADVAYMIGDRSPSGVGPKEAKGKEIFERRRRGSKSS